MDIIRIEKDPGIKTSKAALLSNSWAGTAAAELIDEIKADLPKLHWAGTHELKVAPGVKIVLANNIAEYRLIEEYEVHDDDDEYALDAHHQYDHAPTFMKICNFVSEDKKVIRMTDGEVLIIEPGEYHLTCNVMCSNEKQEFTKVVVKAGSCFKDKDDISERQIQSLKSRLKRFAKKHRMPQMGQYYRELDEFENNPKPDLSKLKRAQGFPKPIPNSKKTR